MHLAHLARQVYALRARSARASRGGGASASPSAAGPAALQGPRPQRSGAARREGPGGSSAETYWKEKLRDAAVGVGDVILLVGFVLVMLYDLLWSGR
ncbi:MAG: hypothetical protein CO163_10790 [Rhodobacterales bacterium CG_4_9_14_3_um_filter_71_31]|nr:MAG: hypothetical protein CO163_10790 [Rhodobacterales bacterium CG_4_9_14_3_um_filter_71_31]